MKGILQGRQLRWLAGVLLLCAGMTQMASMGAGGRLTADAMEGQLESSGLYTQRAQWLQGELDILAQAAGLENAGDAADAAVLAQAGAAQLQGQSLPEPTAGDKLRQMVCQDQPAEALEDEEVVRLLDLLEEQANGLETRAMELPAAEQLEQLVQYGEQAVQRLPFGFGMGALLAVAGLGLLFLPGMGAKGRLFGLALASLGAAGALAVFCRWQVPQPAGLEQPWQQLVSTALDGWFGGARQAAVLYAAGLGALAVLAAAAGLLWGRQSKKGKEES